MYIFNISATVLQEYYLLKLFRNLLHMLVLIGLSFLTMTESSKHILVISLAGSELNWQINLDILRYVAILRIRQCAKQKIPVRGKASSVEHSEHPISV